jgi:tetratricopeptide (TPR) repeat protein
MKGPLFAKPDLKWFVIGALLISAVHQLTIQGHSQGPKLSSQIIESDYRASEDEMQQLLAYAVEHPSAEAYRRVAVCYQNRGEIRRALHYLQEAEKVDDDMLD